jgi:hypothetical protein
MPRALTLEIDRFNGEHVGRPIVNLILVCDVEWREQIGGGPAMAQFPDRLSIPRAAAHDMPLIR